jgi:hypothetical protein
MSKPIKNYDDLLAEEQRLLLQLKSQEGMIKQDLVTLKEGLKPARKAMGILSKMATRDHTGPLVNFGLDFGVDVLIRRILLARAGWFTKIVIPFVVKNYSSHIITEEQRSKLAKKIQSLFNKIRPKADKKTAEETA